MAIYKFTFPTKQNATFHIDSDNCPSKESLTMAIESASRYYLELKDAFAFLLAYKGTMPHIWGTAEHSSVNVEDQTFSVTKIPLFNSFGERSR